MKTEGGANGKTVFCGMVSLRALIEGAQRPQPRRQIERVLYALDRKEKNPKEFAYLSHRAEEGLFELSLCAREEVDEAAGSSTHGGIAAICGERRYDNLYERKLPGRGFFVMTEGIEDPYNFGYALRSLYAAGADGVILTGERTGADGIVCRSSAGASERMELYYADAGAAVDFFRDAGYRIVCADLPDSTPVYDADLSLPLLLVIGGEKRGITRKILDKSDLIVRLEYGRPFDQALSAASAAAVLAFEVFRQNRKVNFL